MLALRCPARRHTQRDRHAGAHRQALQTPEVVVLAFDAAPDVLVGDLEDAATWTTDDNPGPAPQVRLFVQYYDPLRFPRLDHSVGLSKGALGVMKRMLKGEAVSAETSGLGKREWAELMAVIESRD